MQTYLKNYFIEIELIYSVLISAVQQSDSVICIYTFFFHILFLYDLLQDTEYDSLYCTVNLVALSILYIIVCIC